MSGLPVLHTENFFQWFPLTHIQRAENFQLTPNVLALPGRVIAMKTCYTPSLLNRYAMTGHDFRKEFFSWSGVLRPITYLV